MIRAIVVDDEILSRIGIRSFIDGKEDIKVTGVFGKAIEALEYLRNNVVDVVLTDIEMADMSGLDLISNIREEKLASGIIILSCHDNFAYAQEAISKGTNSYLLKMDITEEILIREIKKVYVETKPESKSIRKGNVQQENMIGKGVYVIGVLRIKSCENDEKSIQHLDGVMLVSLLEEVVARYQMGTLFSPYKKEMFIIFQFDSRLTVEERECELLKNLSAINNNVRQYINGEITFGISSVFSDLKETRERYREAVIAVDMDFYELGKTVYTWRKETAQMPIITFSVQFTEENGMEIFSSQLHEICESARKKLIPADTFKGHLIQGLNDLIYQIVHENNFSTELLGGWNLNSQIVSLITKMQSIKQLEKELILLFGKIHTDMLEKMREDEFSKIIRYIEQNLECKISLAELAGIGCMSTASLCKKFKERTGITIIQYINKKRIEKAQILMKNPRNSLWQIAEDTGFANVNYLIRVFKKITGVTVGEYRKQIGVGSNEEGRKKKEDCEKGRK